MPEITDEQIAKYKAAETEVAQLKERAAKAIKQEDYDKLATELKTIKDGQVADEAKSKIAADQSLKDRKEALIKAGVPEAKVRDMGIDLVSVLETTLEFSRKKPAADFSNGGGGSVLSGTPLELSKTAYASSNKSK